MKAPEDGTFFRELPRLGLPLCLFFFLLCIVAGAHIFPNDLFAQDSPGKTAGEKSERVKDAAAVERAPAIVLPIQVPTIPGPRDRAPALVLRRNNLHLFRDLLIAPLAAWIEADLFAARIVKEIDFDWRLSKEWEQKTKENTFSLTPEHAVSPALHVGSGYPFGFANEVNKEIDPVRKAYKILWNVAAGDYVEPELMYDSELMWIGSNVLLRKSSAVLFRLFFPDEPGSDDASAEKQGDTSYFFREVLQLYAPPVVAGFAHLSLRFLNATEDAVWIHSPVIGSTREVMSSNRGDGLLGGLLSAEDLLVWSSKIEGLDARVVDQKTLLVPFPSVIPFVLESAPARGGVAAIASLEQKKTDALIDDVSPEKEESLLTARGSHQRFDASFSMTMWNFENRRFSNKAPWIPSTAYFIPRQVWIIEVQHRDPFRKMGREILVVDMESMRPVYKVVYDQYGEFHHLVMGGWSLAQSKDGMRSVPFASFVVSVSRSSRRATAFSTRFLKLFPDPKSELAVRARRRLSVEGHTPATPKTKPAK